MSNKKNKPKVKCFFDKETNTASYIVIDESTKKCAIFDSVLDFDYFSGKISYTNAEKLIQFIISNKLELQWLNETHIHADHLSAAPYIKNKLGGNIGISSEIIQLQKIFGKVFNSGTEFEMDGSQFDCLFEDGDNYQIGDLECSTMLTPGHTPECMTHIIGDAAFVGDTLFMPDGGTARADFPGGDANQLYNSIKKILSLPEETRIFVCHDYMPEGREAKWETTVGEQKQNNIHINDTVAKDTFVQMREERDSSLKTPKLMIPSIQVNIRAGKMPPKEKDGNIYLKVPISGLKNQVKKGDTR